MAVYKATYCYPFLNTFDPRVVATKTNKFPAQYLKCKVDTSNKTVTGYQIIIRDNENNIVFPVDKDQNNWKISPIQELEQNLDLNGYTNSGINGSYLNIAFIQNLYQNNIFNPHVNGRIYRSYNAVYFKGAYMAQYIISDSTADSDPAGDISNWTYMADPGGDPRKDSLTCNISNWNNILNGELVSEGDIIFVKVNDADKGGLWSVYSKTSLRRYRDYDGNFINNSVVTNTAVKPKICITQGKAPRENNKHYYYYYDGSQFIRFINQQSNAADKQLWVCQKDTGIDHTYMVDLTIQGGSYKWEIILYQGVGEVYDINGNRADVNQLDTANNVYYITYKNMSYEYYDMTLTSGQILGSTLTRFQLANKPTAELINQDNEIVGVLPGENSSTPLVLLNKYAQLLGDNGQSSLSNRVVVNAFDATYGHVYFKEGAITQDIFDKTAKVEFYKYSNVIEDILEGDIVDVATVDTVTIGSSYKIVKSMFGSQIDGITLTQGMKVLIKNASDPRFNGVYIAETGEVDGQEVAWSRAGSYNTWGSFIGKILCVRQGNQNRGKNFQSQAKAGGTLLIPDGTDQGGAGSYLYFNAEQPIILFDTLPDINIYQADLFTTGAFTTVVDGYNVATGDRVVAQEDGQYKIKTRTTTGWSTDPIILTNNDYIKIALGQTYGNKVIKAGSLTSDLTSAYILKNSNLYTFVSPFIGMTKNNALFFYNKNKIDYNTSAADHPETPSYWLKLQDVYEKFWLIKHYKLNKVLDSIDPYKYELRSFFKASDENPFFTYEDPYLKLTPNNSFTISATSGVFEIQTNGRFITLQGEYYQPQQASWSTYRWVLKDQDDNIVQDTGKKYDKDLLTTFYGLNNEEGKNIYFATLYVEDSLNNSLSLTIKINVDTTTAEIGVPFVAEYDCDTQSVILFYDDVPFVKPTVTGPIYSEVYIAEHQSDIEAKTSAKWDNSIIYSNNSLNIKGNNASFGAEWGDNNLSEYTELESSLILRSANAQETYKDESYSVNNGVQYKHFFSEDGLEVENDQNLLKLYSTDPEGISQTDEFTFKTDLVLDNNYCGQILRLEMDGTEPGAGEQQNKVIFTLTIPNNFINTDRTVLNPYRNQIQFDILTKISEDTNQEDSKFNISQYLLKKQQASPQQLSDLIQGRAYHIHVPAHTTGVFTSSSIGMSKLVMSECSNIVTDIQPTDRGSSGETTTGFGCSNGAPICYGFTDCTDTLHQKCYNLDDAYYDFDADIVYYDYHGSSEQVEKLLPFITSDELVDAPVKTFDLDNNPYFYLQFEDSPYQEGEYLHYQYLDNNNSKKIKIYFLKNNNNKYEPYGINHEYSSSCLVHAAASNSALNYWVDNKTYSSSSDKMLNIFTGVYDGSSPSWPSTDSEEQDLYWKENSSFNSNIVGDESQINYSNFDAQYSDCGFIKLISYKRHPEWDQRHYKIELIAKDIAALYTETDLTVEAGNNTADGYYITHVKKDDVILFTIRIKNIID